MAEYIDREALLAKLHEIGGCGAVPDTWSDGYDKGIDAAYGLVQRMPTADVAPVVHGQWISKKAYGRYECSVCEGADCDCSDYYGTHSVKDQEFCPWCGARMDGGC